MNIQENLHRWHYIDHNRIAVFVFAYFFTFQDFLVARLAKPRPAFIATAFAHCAG